VHRHVQVQVQVQVQVLAGAVLLGGVAAACSTPAAARRDPLLLGDGPLSPAETVHALDVVTGAVKASLARGEQPAVMFDLDSTLFDNRPRTLTILKEYASADPASTPALTPQAREALAGLTVDQVQWGLEDTLAAVGLAGQKALADEAHAYWKPRFTSDEHLHDDVAYEGAAAYVRTLHAAGARIVYLTGRHSEQMFLGTVAALRTHGFPIGVAGTELIMKPADGPKTRHFKEGVTAYLRRAARMIATFENEPENANALHAGIPEAHHFLILTNHRPGGPPLAPGITRFPGYYFTP
jgi:hypothetical protein